MPVRERSELSGASAAQKGHGARLPSAWQAPTGGCSARMRAHAQAQSAIALFSLPLSGPARAQAGQPAPKPASQPASWPAASPTRALALRGLRRRRSELRQLLLQLPHAPQRLPQLRQLHLQLQHLALKARGFQRAGTINLIDSLQKETSHEVMGESWWMERTRGGTEHTQWPSWQPHGIRSG